MTMVAESHAPLAPEGRHEFTVELPLDVLSIAVARAVVRRVTTFISDDAESSFLIALTEVVSNALDEHRRLDIAEPITVSIEFEDDDVVRVIDRGHGISPVSVEPLAIEVDDESGRGLTLARAFVPHMTFDSDQHGTTVTLPLVGLGIIR